MAKESKEQEVSAAVVESGTKIVIPEGMSLKQALGAIERQMRREEEKTAINAKIPGVMLDAAHAFMLALQDIFGWTSLVPTPGFFGPTPPIMIDVPVGPNGKSVQVPWGRIELPGIEGYLATYSHDGTFIIGGEVKRKHEKTIEKVIALTKEKLLTHSIFRSKTLAITYKEMENPFTGNRYREIVPEFIDLSGVKEDELIFTGVLKQAIESNLFAPLERTEECRKFKVPLKRGILMTGPYGVGKTLAANNAAVKANRNGWTFLYCKQADDLKDVLKVAQQYSPAVVFCEDLDRVTSGERDIEMDAILNIIDGIESKTAEIMVVLTTNDVESIHSAMLRPGRLDAVIDVTPPDAEGVQKLMRNYGRGLIPEKESLQMVGKALEGRIPAVIREVVERAKLDAISLGEPGQDTIVLSEPALLSSAETMNMQLRLLDRQPVRELSDRERAAQVAAEATNNVADAIREVITTTYGEDGVEETETLPSSVAELAGLADAVDKHRA